MKYLSFKPHWVLLCAICILNLWIVKPIRAQNFTAGIKGGIGSSKLSFKDVRLNGLQIKQGESILAWHAGIFTRISLLGFHIQPELYYIRSGGKAELQDGSAPQQSGDFKYHQFEIPVLAGYTFLSFLRAQAGPVFSFTLNNNVKGFSGAFQNLEESYKNAAVGYQLGLGIDLFRLTFDARFEGDLSKLGSSITLPGGQKVSTDFKSKQFVFSLGYKLIK